MAKTIYVARCSNGGYTVVGEPEMLRPTSELRKREPQNMTIQAALASASQACGLTFSEPYDDAATQSVNGYDLDIRAYVSKEQ